MGRVATVVVLCALVGAGGAGGVRTGGTPLAFVGIPGASEVAVVYLGTGQVNARLRVPRGPQELTAYHEAARRDFVLVTSPSAGAVTMIDARTLRIVKVWRGFGKPSDVAVTGTRAYVTDTSRGQLIVLDLRSRRVQARIYVDGRPAALAAADVAVIADERRPLLTLVDVARRRVIARMPAAGVVSSISKRPDSADVFVSYRGGSVASVDWGRQRIVFRRDVGTSASDVVFDFHNSDRLFVADDAEARVRALSARKGRPIRTVGGCPRAHRLGLVHPWRVVATCPGSSSLTDWDMMSGRLRRIPLEGVPSGVAVVVLP